MRAIHELKKEKNKTNEQKKRLTSQNSGSSSRTESCQSILTVGSDGTTNLRAVFVYITRKSNSYSVIVRVSVDLKRTVDGD